LCLQGDGHPTSEDHIGVTHLILVLGIGSAMIASMGFLGHRCWWRHLLVIQKSFALFQIVSNGMMDLALLFYVSKTME
jgi:hypothetical protein